MNKPISIARTIVIVAGLVQIVLGLLFWSGIGKGLVPVHATIGFVLVLSLLTLTFLAARAGAPIGLVALVAVWAVVVPVFGIAQTHLLVGSGHWIIEAVHSLLGLAAMGLASILASRVQPRGATADWDTREPAGP
jgi:hypothetical protein